MNIVNVIHQTITSPAVAPLVNDFAAPSALQTDLRASVFKPVGQVVQTQGQTTHLNPGAVYSPLHNAVQAYGFHSDVAASLVTYGANGKMTGSNGLLSSRQDIAKVNPDHLHSSSDLSDNLQARDVTIQARDVTMGSEGTGLLNPSIDYPSEVATQKKEQQAEQKMQDEIRALAARDKEVRAHEQAHAAIGGVHAGAPKYQFEQGPNGVNYAVGGEVPIDVSPAATAEQTLEKAQTIRRAAMAPSEPSPQDRQVAQEAVQLEVTAKQQIAAERAQATTTQMNDTAINNSSQNSSTTDVASTKNVHVRTVNVSADIEGFNLSKNIVSATKAFNNVETTTDEAKGDLSLRVVSAYQANTLKPTAPYNNVNAFA